MKMKRTEPPTTNAGYHAEAIAAQLIHLGHKVTVESEASDSRHSARIRFVEHGVSIRIWHNAQTTSGWVLRYTGKTTLSADGIYSGLTKMTRISGKDGSFKHDKFAEHAAHYLSLELRSRAEMEARKVSRDLAADLHREFKNGPAKVLFSASPHPDAVRIEFKEILPPHEARAVAAAIQAAMSNRSKSNAGNTPNHSGSYVPRN